MRGKIIFLLALSLSLSACLDQTVSTSAPVMHFGLRADSATGAVIVEGRDTVYNIAKRYRLPLREIIALNNLEPPYPLTKGQRLKLPAPMDYRTKTGDTVDGIAKTFGVAVSRLVKVNNLTAPYILRSGQVLRIPTSYRNEALETEEPMIVAAAPIARVQVEAIPLSAPTIKPPVKPAAPNTTILSTKRPNFIWPLRGKIISGYGAKDGGLYNDGINIAAPRGAPISAAADGVIAYIGNDLKSYGNLVLIRHSGGTITAYAHLSTIHVKKGTTVKMGQTIGAVGSSGAVSTSQLHFEIRKGSKAYDPKKYLG